jgi:hypothetical protein
MGGREATLIILIVLGSLVLGGRAARAQAPGLNPEEPAAVQPPTPPPSDPPPAPRQIPDPPSGHGDAQGATPGQWVYTEQYGWVWMPYGDPYTHVPSGGDPPVMYVYLPTDGWCWVDAPWIWGWGVAPYFGLRGPARYRWWGNGYGRWNGYSGRYRTWGGRGQVSRPGLRPGGRAEGWSGPRTEGGRFGRAR